MQPSAFTNQQRLLQSRFPPAYAAHDDDARSSTGSVNSWINVDTQETQPDPWAEDQSDEDGLPLPPADLKVSRPTLDPAASSAAPVTQAARNLLHNANEPPASQRLRRQQELAQKKGKKSARFVQLGAHNACNIMLPPHIQQVGSGRGERSIMVLDHRDQRLQSPFQGWLLDEILTNANARISITSDVRLLRSPTTGISLQHLHDEDARQLQDGAGWIHDFLWLSSMRSLGLGDRGSAIARGFSAVQMADHEE